ncbi:biotin-independent malonate decarboxylase subunit gamma [Acetobacter sp. DsW_063]|uniref:biotin-independent malonate decarboxylase subunit gamma n=1 Tax=Acetobacter sp. DsW_063 TaxID=1514894 RepID=UPI000A3B02C9|nr:biotin-independent malonate decarboxylase subunit gamma [Acetobacter sp. DsW_063]OUJ16464.1 hypothetical protein HK28_12315 [Acetobacter sp. DsW_063]
MTPVELLSRLFPSGHDVVAGPSNTLAGRAKLTDGAAVEVVGVTDGAPLSPETAIELAGVIIRIVQDGKKTPIVLLIDTASQRMTRRDEMLGLNEYLAHLAKVVTLAGLSGHRTVAVLYGAAAAGAFIATALAAQTLITVDGAHPSVMDLPSIARVTKLPLEVLEKKAETTPIFAPGVTPLAATGAVMENWTVADNFSDRIESALTLDASSDTRDTLGEERGGRKVAHSVALRVAAEFGKAAR